MKSFEEIRAEFWQKRLREEIEARAKTVEARGALDALLQRAGIKDRPENPLSEGADKWSEDYYRPRIREMVFELPDVELRRQIIIQISIYRFELYDYWQKLNTLENRLAADLREKRCELPLLSSPVAFLGLPPAVMCLAYWRGSAIDALVAGFGVVLPAIAFVALHLIRDLHRYDVIMQEAITFAERFEAASKAEASRRLHLLVEIFSRHEGSTGEPDPES